MNYKNSKNILSVILYSLLPLIGFLFLEWKFSNMVLLYFFDGLFLWFFTLLVFLKLGGTKKFVSNSFYKNRYRFMKKKHGPDIVSMYLLTFLAPSFFFFIFLHDAAPKNIYELKSAFFSILILFVLNMFRSFLLYVKINFNDRRIVNDKKIDFFREMYSPYKNLFSIVITAVVILNLMNFVDFSGYLIIAFLLIKVSSDIMISLSRQGFFYKYFLKLVDIGYIR